MILNLSVNHDIVLLWLFYIPQIVPQKILTASMVLWHITTIQRSGNYNETDLENE